MYSLASTHSGGGLLWVSTEFATFVGFVPIFVQWMRSDERMAARDDIRDEHALTPVALTGEMVATPQSASQPLVPARRAERDLTAWEAAWMAKTGHVPERSAGA